MEFKEAYFVLAFDLKPRLGHNIPINDTRTFPTKKLAWEYVKTSGYPASKDGNPVGLIVVKGLIKENSPRRAI